MLATEALGAPKIIKSTATAVAYNMGLDGKTLVPKVPHVWLRDVGK